MANNYNICTHLIHQAQLRPDTMALVDSTQSFSYAELNALTEQYAAFFTTHGLDSSNKALLLEPLSARFYAIFLGLVRIGVQVILLDPGMGIQQMVQCCQTVQPDTLIGTPKSHILRLVPKLRTFFAHSFSTGKHWVPFTQTITRMNPSGHLITYLTPADHPCLITFTSGSTGAPKGIVRTHGFLAQQNRLLIEHIPPTPHEKQLTTLPVFVLSNLGKGITTVLPDLSQSTSDAWMHDTVLHMEQQAISTLLAAPSFCQGLVDQIATQPISLKHLQHIYTGGGPVSANLLKRLKRYLPHTRVSLLYGSTEAEPIALQQADKLSQDAYEQILLGLGLPAGKPIDEISVAIIADQWGTPLGSLSSHDFLHMKLLSGCVGEIVVSGTHVQKGYINPENDKETKFRVDNEVWHRTGDAGYIDEEGKLWLMGRCSAKMSTKSGQVLYPFSIEASAESFPEIRKSACIQINNDIFLAIEGEPLKEKNRIWFQNYFSELTGIIQVKQIPTDKRHRTKVLYTELRNMLINEYADQLKIYS